MEDRIGGEGNVEPPAAHPDASAEAGQAPGGADASRPASPQPDSQTADPVPGFMRTFPNVWEFLAFTKAEVERSEPSSSSWEEDVHAREERVAADEELLNARELRLSRQHEELQ